METDRPVIVLALDGSRTALRAVETARRIAQALPADLDVLYVVESPLVHVRLPEPILVGDFRPEGSGYREEANTYLTGVWEEIPGARIYVGFGRPAREIVRFATQRHAELIVMTTNGRTGLARAVLGSVAEECVRTSPVPVLVIPGSTKKPAARPARKVEWEFGSRMLLGGRLFPPPGPDL